MDTGPFVARFPRLHHLAHADAWPSLRAHGLLSAEALLRRSSLGRPSRTSCWCAAGPGR